MGNNIPSKARPRKKLSQKTGTEREGKGERLMGGVKGKVSCLMGSATVSSEVTGNGETDKRVNRKREIKSQIQPSRRIFQTGKGIFDKKKGWEKGHREARTSRELKSAAHCYRRDLPRRPKKWGVGLSMTHP